MGTAAGSQARYDEWADWYEQYITGDAQNFTQRTAEILAQVLGPGAGPLLDLACGTGIYGQTFSTLGWTPFGVDLSVGQLRHARRRMPVAVAEASTLPMRTGTLAAVTAVLCHTDIDDYALTCQALSLALRRGGVSPTSASTPATSELSLTAPTQRRSPSHPVTGSGTGALKAPGAGYGPRSEHATYHSASY
jgi:SAM-dependent methyltransferase